MMYLKNYFVFLPDLVKTTKLNKQAHFDDGYMEKKYCTRTHC